MRHDAAVSDESGTATQRLRSTWPLDRAELRALFGCYVAMTAIWSVIGFVLIDVLEGSAILRADERLSRWLADRRTPAWNTASHIGSLLSEVAVKIVVTAAIGVLLLRRFRRWFEALVVAVPLILEAMIFITVTYIVGRPRPDVPRLDGSPVGTSFPSGHVAAAVCYSAIAVVVFWHTRRRWIRAVVVVVCAVVPVIVGLARMYRGMHFLSDVVAGAIIGAMSTYLVVRLMKRAHLARLDRQMDGLAETGPPGGESSNVERVPT